MNNGLLHVRNNGTRKTLKQNLQHVVKNYWIRILYPYFSKRKEKIFFKAEPQQKAEIMSPAYLLYKNY